MFNILTFPNTNKSGVWLIDVLVDSWSYRKKYGMSIFICVIIHGMNLEISAFFFCLEFNYRCSYIYDCWLCSFVVFRVWVKIRDGQWKMLPPLTQMYGNT